MSLFSSSALWRNVKEFVGWIDGGSENTPEFDDLRLVHVGDVRFLAVPVAKELPVGNEAPKFLTVIDAEDRPRISGDWVSEQLEIFKSCDTFQPDFLRGVLFISSDADDAVIGAEAQAILVDVGVEWTNTVSYEADQPQLRSGPHLLANGQFFELQRLHDDVQECFVSTVVLPKPTSSFRTVPFTGTGSRTLAAAVPSRLQRRAANPIAGLRIAVKDNFHIAGVKTSLCNKAYHALYPAPDRTAACIQRLVDAGAAVVGKTKLASFAATEEPVECVDFSAPWNPRADGYQSPAGSSSGSGAAVAAYAWLDVTLGSDTSGSGRRPGHWNGCVAMRPSHGAVSVEGFVPSFARFDVPTFFGRDLRMFRDFAEGWYGHSLPKLQAELPISIVVPTDYLATIGNEDQLRLIEEFVSDLEDFFRVQRRELSLESCWAGSPPKEAQDLGLLDFMKDACRNSFWYDDFHSMSEFRKDYEEQFGCKPYVSPPVRWQWNIASEITREDRDSAVRKLDVYQKWFSEEVMKVGQLNTIVVLPVEEVSPRYRDEPPSRKFYPTGVPMLFLSPILKAPELTIPIGQVPYHSKVTGCGEFLPVGISLMASPGSDILLMDSMFKFLVHSKRPTMVQPGQHMFPHG